MGILSSWKESLKILLPKNLRLFTLVTIKAVGETYRALPYRWWGVSLLFGFLIVYTSVYAGDKVLCSGVPCYEIPFRMFRLAVFVGFLFWFFFVVCAAARPSVMLKDRAYYRSFHVAFEKSLILFFTITLAWWGISYALMQIAQKLFFHGESFSLLQSGMATLSQLLLLPYSGDFALSDFFVSIMNVLLSWGPLYIVTTLFMLDRCSIRKTVQKSIVMIVHNYPLFIAIRGLMALLFWAIKSIFNNMPLHALLTAGMVLYSLVIFVVMPIVVTLVSNIYIKRIHDEPELYV